MVIQSQVRIQVRCCIPEALLFPLSSCCPKNKDLAEFLKNDFLETWPNQNYIEKGSWLWTTWKTEYTQKYFQPRHTEMLNKLKSQQLLHYWAWKIDRVNFPVLEKKRINSCRSQCSQMSPRRTCCQTAHLAQGRRLGPERRSRRLRRVTWHEEAEPHGTSQNLEAQRISSPHAIENSQLTGRKMGGSLL